MNSRYEEGDPDQDSEKRAGSDEAKDGPSQRSVQGERRKGNAKGSDASEKNKDEKNADDTAETPRCCPTASRTRVKGPKTASDRAMRPEPKKAIRPRKKRRTVRERTAITRRRRIEDQTRAKTPTIATRRIKLGGIRPIEKSGIRS